MKQGDTTETNSYVEEIKMLRDPDCQSHTYQFKKNTENTMERTGQSNDKI